MPYQPIFELRSFDQLPAKARCRLVLQLVRALVEVNCEFLKIHPETPALYESGVIYRPQQTAQGTMVGADLWWDIPTVLQMGEGSCEDLAAWRVAELRMAGYNYVRPFVHSRDLGASHTLYHVVVVSPDGEEDPSVLLGMPPNW